jgi:hypothetical protein
LRTPAAPPGLAAGPTGLGLGDARGWHGQRVLSHTACTGRRAPRIHMVSAVWACHLSVTDEPTSRRDQRWNATSQHFLKKSKPVRVDIARRLCVVSTALRDREGPRGTGDDGTTRGARRNVTLAQQGRSSVGIGTSVQESSTAVRTDMGRETTPSDRPLLLGSGYREWLPIREVVLGYPMRSPRVGAFGPRGSAQTGTRLPVDGVSTCQPLGPRRFGAGAPCPCARREWPTWVFGTAIGVIKDGSVRARRGACG